MMSTSGGMDGFSMLFGFFGLLYMVIILFIVVLTIVFLFKAMSYMKRKNAADQEQNELLRQLLSKQTSSSISTSKEDPTSY
ncbi:hypothetical protein [Guptibacillus hwajinpoensis]|uniref:hypothetical protein n=1 Tax=Guptibacillus hwajinpoensis TaxID=208199 RepID=UPI001CFF5366|nr:hypothetical protein [Pseudalkalibacillus hwajinpoensis]WLR58646.1 hypothetical protein LC071_15935 [Pseudalkalibacillus hwajinpoensis]